MPPVRRLDDATIADILEGSGHEGSDDEEDRPISGDEEQDTSSSSDCSGSDSDDQPLIALKWKKARFASKPVPEDSSTHGDTRVRTPVEYFEQYFTESLFGQISLATNQYYMTKTGSQMKPICTPEEIKKFFGIHGLMGCIKFPRIKLFWNQRFKYDPIASAMSRERFFMLRVNIHAVDVHSANHEEEQSKNKLWRVQPVVDAVRNRCLALPRISGSYSVDEQMIPFGGRCRGMKVVVKNKPRPEGLKNYVLTTYTGLVLDFEIYQGPTTNLPDVAKFGLAPAVILRLVSSLPDGSFIYFDRHFSTLALMTELLERKKEGTGTLMMNRFNTKNKTRYEFKKDAKMARGDDEEIVSGDGRVCIVKWKDNKGVIMISTAHGAEPRSKVQRWDKKNRAYIEVSCPSIIKNYNTFMGGVDIFDQMIETYRTWIKSRKWTVKVILHLFDLAIVNSWFEYRNECKSNKMKAKDIMDLLAFRLTISEYLLAGPPRKRSREDPEFAEMPSTSKYRHKPLPTVDKQRDGFNHWPIFDTLKQPRSCRAPNCSSRSRCRCTKCDVYLCLTKDKNCFYNFHNED